MHSQRLDVATRLSRIAIRAQQQPTAIFDNLLSLLTVDFLRDCFHALNRQAASGVDDQTWDEYAEQLETRLVDLVARLHRMGYHPLPVRRVQIPKEGKKTRPLGIPTIEDKLVQEGLRRVLTPIFEADFLECSYGFRPGRSCHQALYALEQALVHQPVNYVIDADIRGYFDHVDHALLLTCVQRRITDRRVIRYLVRFLKAGVLEDGALQAAAEEGVPQGGVISPLLANIFLHYALDVWLHRIMRPQLQGYVLLNRYADDFVIGVQYEADALWLLAKLKDRLARCKLTLAEEKTRLMLFSRYAAERAPRSRVPVGTFDYLGFTHYWRQNGRDQPIYTRRTSRKKFRQKVKQLVHWLQEHRTELTQPPCWDILCAKLRGHYQYYGLPGNSIGLTRFYEVAKRAILRNRQRCTQRSHWTWARLTAYLKWHPLPLPRLPRRHGWEVTYPSWRGSRA